MSGPTPLDVGEHIRGVFIERLARHTWATPREHPAIAVIPGTTSRGWCEACARETADQAVGEGYTAETVISAFDGLVPPAFLQALVAGRPGPRPIVESADVERARAELIAAKQSAGERRIAAKLGVSRDAVRYAQGKDRRRPRA